MGKNELEKALKEIPNANFQKFKIEKPTKISYRPLVKKIIGNNYKIGEEIATRVAYGKALANLAKSDERVIVIDAEVSNSTRTDEVKKIAKDQFIEAFIAEQNLVGMCLGMSKKGFDVFGSSFATFLTRAHDQIRMSALSSANFTLCGSHSGVSIGDDGASQMGLDDIAMFRDFPSSIIFYPSDAVSTEKLVLLSAKLNGIKYIRTTRGKTRVLYDDNEKFKVGDFKILKQSAKDKLVLVGAGITLHECLNAHSILKFSTAVVDLFCVKPFDSKKFIGFVKKHGGKIIVVEDHYSEGGIGEMLAGEIKNSGIKIESLAVREIPHSGKSEELLEKYGIGRKAITKIAEKLIKCQ